MATETEKIMVNFDSQDWNSIRDTINKINMIGELQIGTTAEGETIILDLTSDGGLKTDVIQKNGWIRTNEYYPDTCEITETYRKE